MNSRNFNTILACTLQLPYNAGIFLQGFVDNETCNTEVNVFSSNSNVSLERCFETYD
jgi:hypothetical protein